MPALDNIKALIEALRGGNTTPNSAAADQASLRSTYNPQGLQVNGPQDLHAPIGGSMPGAMAGLGDSEYREYVKNARNPKPYMKWVEEGE